MALHFEGIHHRYDSVEVLRGIDLHIEHGEIVCLLGPSGCGKTTLLRLAAGLERLQAGRITVEGRLMADASHSVPPEERGVGLLFQDFALFPHLSVWDNVAFGLSHWAADERTVRADEVLRQVGMIDFADAFPHTLSGGQQQRVALARALAPKPRVVLLDEPFSGLDTRLRDRVRDDTLHALQESGTAAMMVTHDPEEAMFMADRIAVMSEGRILQVGSPATLYQRPASGFVAAFLGEINRLEGRASGGVVPTPLGRLPVSGMAEGQAVEVLIRPEGLRLLPAGAEGATPAVVEASRMLGRTTMVHLHVEGPGGRPMHLHARVPSEVSLARDTPVAVALDEARTYIFPVGTGTAAG
ncbi:MAG: ABC transporter ATP-binding protein [Alphaproteobacteria bacterium]|nr:ABC transporter ATP-binding protein [Alphaproteobacteria bacterium]